MVMHLMGCRGWAPLLSAAPPLCAVGLECACVCVIYIVVTGWLLTRAAACRLCPASQPHWLPWALPTGREADYRLLPSPNIASLAAEAAFTSIESLPYFIYLFIYFARPPEAQRADSP